MDIDFHSDYIAAYMRAVENTESPRLFHLWASISAVACAIGRKAWVPLGMVGRVFPNHFILLVGPPAVRKSVSLNIAYRLVKESTNVRFAPTDTGGQRQGLIRAMSRGGLIEELNDLVDAGINDPFQGLQPADIEVMEKLNESMPDTVNRHVIAAYWTELSGALGQANYSMMDFLVQAYDGDDYRYETKHGETTLNETLINILACTTPSSMSVTMPPMAEGHGFLSRFILVHGDENYQNVVWPELPNSDLLMRIKDTLSFVNKNLEGPATVDEEGKRYAESLYTTQLEITDQRFAHYKSRRFTHLLKLSLVLAASRRSLTITKKDLEVAHGILRITERSMPDALGQFGLSPLAKIKQGILEFLRSAGGPVPVQTIHAAFHKDARPQDILDALSDLLVGDAILRTSTSTGTSLYSAKRNKRETINSEMAHFLIERKDGKK